MDCKKSHRLIGTDVFKVDAQKLINNVMSKTRISGLRKTTKLLLS